jgi:hypothetical protein
MRHAENITRVRTIPTRGPTQNIPPIASTGMMRLSWLPFLPDLYFSENFLAVKKVKAG